ncbi:MAG: hypothetical protein J2P17_11505 [Mycobacterium sp.]|nr:hypothetical protein [Mycobacterium sp.]
MLHVIRARGVTLAAAALVTVSLVSAPARATAAPFSAGQGSLPSWCEPATLVSDQMIPVPEGPDGGAPSSPVMARVLTYNDFGTRMTESVPPVDWRPTSASAAELKFFGIPARPATGTELDDWLDEWGSHYAGIGIGTPCRPITSNSAATSPNWSGEVATRGGYTEAYGTATYQPGSACATQPDSYANWVGLGGGNGSSVRLLQNGFWHSHGTGSYPFVEAINGLIDTSTIPFALGFSYSVGDRFNIATTYNTTTNTVQFGWHDITSGGTYVISLEVFFVGSTEYPASVFYDGSTGEAIDERGSIGQFFTTLRNFGTDTWTNATVRINGGARTAIRAEPHQNLVIRDAEGVQLTSESGPANDLTTYSATWKSCGHVDP